MRRLRTSSLSMLILALLMLELSSIPIASASAEIGVRKGDLFVWRCEFLQSPTLPVSGLEDYFIKDVFMVVGGTDGTKAFSDARTIAYRGDGTIGIPRDEKQTWILDVRDSSFHFFLAPPGLIRGDRIQWVEGVKILLNGSSVLGGKSYLTATDVVSEWWLGLPRDVVYLTGHQSYNLSMTGYRYDSTLAFDGKYDRSTGIALQFSFTFTGKLMHNDATTTYFQSLKARLLDTNAQLSVSPWFIEFVLVLLAIIIAISLARHSDIRSLISTHREPAVLIASYAVAVLVRAFVVLGAGGRLPFWDPPGTWRHLFTFLGQQYLPSYERNFPFFHTINGVIVVATGVSSYGAYLWGPVLLLSLFAPATYALAKRLTRSFMKATYAAFLAATVDLLAVRTSYATAEGYAIIVLPAFVLSLVLLSQERARRLVTLSYSLLLVLVMAFTHLPTAVLALEILAVYFLANMVFFRALLKTHALLLGGAIIFGLAGLILFPSFFERELKSILGLAQGLALVLSNLQLPSLQSFYQFNATLLSYPQTLMLMQGSIISIVLALSNLLSRRKERSEVFLSVWMLIQMLLLISAAILESTPLGYSGYLSGEFVWVYSYRALTYALIPSITMAGSTLDSIRTRHKRRQPLLDCTYLFIYSWIALNSATFLRTLATIYST